MMLGMAMATRTRSLGAADSPAVLFTVNMTPYGDIQLNLKRRLDLTSP